jgi:hypothetical protein
MIFNIKIHGVKAFIIIIDMYVPVANLGKEKYIIVELNSYCASMQIIYRSQSCIRVDRYLIVMEHFFF